MENSSELQSLLSNNGGSVDTSSLLGPIMPILQIATVAGIVLTVIVIIYFIVNIVQKQREHAAILRIDKNLQKLVDNHEQKAKSDSSNESPVAVATTEADETNEAPSAS